MTSSAKAITEATLLMAILAAGLWIASPELLILAIPIAAHLAFGLVTGPRGRENLGLDCEVSPSRVAEGDPVKVELSLTWGGPGRAIALLTDVSRLSQLAPPGAAGILGITSPGEPLSLEYLVHPPRGRYPIREARGELVNALGFTCWSGRIPCRAGVRALPQFERLSGITFNPRRSLVTPGTVRSGRGGLGLEYFRSREYFPGDDVRRLSWKVLARWDRLVINEYEEERAAEVFIVMDVRSAAYGSHASSQQLFDVTVRGAAGMADYAVRQGHRVGLLLYGERIDWVMPSSGRRHGERLLAALARARPVSSVVFGDLAHIPARLLSRGCQLIVVSPLVPGDEETLAALRGRGYAVMALVPDPLSIESTEEREDVSLEIARRILSLKRRVLLRGLASSGVRALVWDVHAPLAPQARAAWRRA